MTLSNFVTNITNTSYTVKIKSSNSGIYTEPIGGFNSILVTSYLYNNKDVKVIEEALTLTGTFLKVLDINTGKIIGCIRNTDVTMVTSGSNTTATDYKATVLSGNDGIYTSPKGTPGAVLVTSYVYNNKRIRVTEEVVTPAGTFSKLSQIDGGKLIGWINKEDLQISHVVFLDVGHGGTDSGAYYYGVAEKDINLQVSNIMKKQLESKGYTVIMSRTTDTFIDHKTDRSIMANQSGADIFISVHHNAMPGNSTVTGIETFYYEYDPDYQPKVNQDMHNDAMRLLNSATLANNIQNMLIQDTGAYDRGVKRDTYAVLRETALPSVLVELGFMSNEAELRKLTTTAYQEVLASAVAKGINSYFKLQ